MSRSELGESMVSLLPRSARAIAWPDCENQYIKVISIAQRLFPNPYCLTPDDEGSPALRAETLHGLPIQSFFIFL